MASRAKVSWFFGLGKFKRGEREVSGRRPFIGRRVIPVFGSTGWPMVLSRIAEKGLLVEGEREDLVLRLGVGLVSRDECIQVMGAFLDLIESS